MKKIHRQEATWVMKPPMGGPTTGATRAGQVRVATARIRSCLAVRRMTTSRPTGVIMAPPHPCRTRATVNSRGLRLAPHRMEASVNSAMAQAKTLWAPNRSAAQPLAGMKTARVSR